MTILEFIQSNEPTDRSRMQTIYGEGGTGKTTYACSFPDPLLIPTEVGFRDLKVDHIPLVKTYMELLTAINGLITIEELPYKTVVLDSGDWVEPMIEADLQAEGFDMDYGKGASEIGLRFKRVMDGLRVLHETHDVNIIVICHAHAVTVHRPEGGEYDRWMPKLSRKSCEYLIEGCDEVGYVFFDTAVVTEKGAFGKEQGVAHQTGARCIGYAPHGAWKAKNRFRSGEVPNRIPLSYEEYKKLLP